jgi:hypothetical protein
VAGSGAVAVNATGFGNIITNRVESFVRAGSHVQTLADSIGLSATDTSSIRSLGLSIAGSGAIAAGALLGANVITNAVLAEISGSSVDSASTLDLNAQNNSNILGLTFGVAGSAIGAGFLSLSANVISNSTQAGITEGAGLVQSLTPATGAKKDFDPLAKVDITNNTIDLGTDNGLGTGDALVYSTAGYTPIGGLIDGATYYAIVDDPASGKIRLARTKAEALAKQAINLTSAGSAGSNVHASGAVSLSAKDTSTINALAFSIAGSGGVALGAALSVNVIADSVHTVISGSTLNTPSALSLTSESSAIIRTLVIGVSGSGGFALQLTAVGNVITNSIMAEIRNGSNVSAGDISLLATDKEPDGAPDMMTAIGGLIPDNNPDPDNGNKTTKGKLTDSLEDSPIKLLSANILSLVVGIAGSGLGAVNATLVGNFIINTVAAQISGSTVNPTGKLELDAISAASIMSITAGLAGAGGVAANATGFGNVIKNKSIAAITGGSIVTAGGLIDLAATDQSRIFSIGLSFAGSGGLALSGLFGANVITNTVEADISASKVSTLSTLKLSAESKNSITSFTGGVAVAGGVAGMMSISVNVVHGSTLAVIDGESDVDATGAVTLSAKDTSVIDALAFGASVSGAAAAGMGVALNDIANTIRSVIDSSVVDTASSLTMTAESSSVIRMLVIGV